MTWHGLSLPSLKVEDPREFADFLRDEGRSHAEIEAAVYGQVTARVREWLQERLAREKKRGSA